MLDTKDTVDKVANQNEFLRRRVDELEFILHKSHKRNLVFDDLDKRLLALENRVHTFSIDISNNLESMKFHHSLTNEKVYTMEQFQEVI